MDYIKSYKDFIGSYQLTEGLRKTAGILIPPFLFSYAGYHQVGLVLAVGALSVSIADNPGSIKHQRNGLLAANAIIFITALITGLAAHFNFLLAAVLVIFSFLFSMLGIYGTRVSAIGLAGLIVMSLNIFSLHYGWQIVYNALYLLAGGIWYLLLTLALYTFRPYKAVKQTLGDMVQSMGTYLQIRANFYLKGEDQDNVFKQLFHQQVLVQEKQELVGDMLFKTRSIVRESTHTGRILLVIYLDAIILFEKINTTYQDYTMLHRYFDDTGILDRYRNLILMLADELDIMGIGLKNGEQTFANKNLPIAIEEVKTALTDLRHRYMKPDNIEGFIYLRNIINNIQDISEKISNLHQYTSFDERLKIRKEKIDHETFVSRQDYTPKIFLDNLSLKSEIFRHALRVSLAILAGYIIGEAFDIGHSYWILLTIIIIMKPAFSLTRQRNKDRLEGTITGIFIGIVILLVVKNITILLIILVLLMAASNTLMRSYYFWSVACLTPTVLIFLNFLHDIQFTTLLTDRFIDTAIGGAIAFVTSSFLLPSWEHQKLKSSMLQMLEQNRTYFKTITTKAAQEASHNALIKNRKNTYVALANLTGTFNRMLSEPKSKQPGLQQVHQFIVINHMLISHFTSLKQQMEFYNYSLDKEVLENVVKDIDCNFEKALNFLKNSPTESEEVNPKKALKLLNRQADELMEKRKTEVQAGLFETETLQPLVKLKSVVNQFNFIYNLSTELQKNSKQVTRLVN